MCQGGRRMCRNAFPSCRRTFCGQCEAACGVLTLMCAGWYTSFKELGMESPCRNLDAAHSLVSNWQRSMPGADWAGPC